MERLYTKETVLQVLQNVLEFETTTLGLYEDYIGQLADGEVVKAFEQLRDEEIQHVRSVKELIQRVH
jgi:rubrerythrin